MFRFNVLPGPFGADAYGTTRNTSLTFSVNLNRAGGSDSFASSGEIKITVGGTSFKDLDSASESVEIKISQGTIKKCVDGSPTNFTQGTSEALPRGTKLYIEATGEISGIANSEVTIKGTVEVSSKDKPLGDQALTIGGSDGLSGTLNLTGTDKVTIKDSTINLTDNALKALKSLTQNAVTLTGSSGFKSSASIIVTRTSGTSNFKALDLNGQGLKITINSGTIKMYNDKGELEDLTTETPLSVDTKLLLDATGQITQPSTARAAVKLKGTIVVTSDNKPIGGNTLTFGGGTSNGVTGTLNLQDVNEGGKKHVKISSTSSSTLTISSDAYTAIPTEYKTTDTLKIGDPDAKSTPRNPAGTGVTGDDFTEYWELLPPDRYDSDESLEWTVVSPALMVLLIATFFPPVIVALLNRGQFADKK